MSPNLPDILAGATDPQMTVAARDVLRQVAGDSPQHLRGMVSDQFGFWRAKRLSRLAERTQQFAGRNVRLSPVALRTLLPLLEAGSLEEDDEMQDRWAALLASAGIAPQGVPPSFVELLRSLSPEEAQLLESIADNQFSIDDPEPRERTPVEGQIFIRMRVPWTMDLDYPDPETPEGRIVAVLDRRDPHLRVRLSNLDRMGLVTCRPNGSERSVVRAVVWALTALGDAFIEACRMPTAAAPTQTGASDRP